MKFNMIVLMTSWDPNLAFRTPGIAPQMPPPRIAAMKQSGIKSHADRFAKRNSHPRGGKCSEVELTFSSNVEQVRNEKRPALPGR